MSITDRPGPSPRTYPIPAPADDTRFNYGLILDIADVLTAHGYPKVNAGGDLRELHQALYRFLYAPTEPARPATSKPKPAARPVCGDCQAYLDHPAVGFGTTPGLCRDCSPPTNTKPARTATSNARGHHA